MALLKVSGITKKVEGSWTLKEVSFSQKRHQKIAIAGETGSGKSTLLKIIAGLSQADRGEVLFENKRVEGPGETLVPGHPDIAYLSQHFELPKFLKVEQVLSYASIMAENEAKMIYEICQIDHLLERKTDQLSGGERQRIALARLLTSWPTLLLLDEPFSNLDMMHKSTLKTVIDNISKKLGITCILVSHDPADTLSWANEVLVMKEGQIVQKGTPEQIYRQPINEYVAGLFGKYTLIETAQIQAWGGESGLSKDQSKKKALLIRPEQLSIGEKHKEGWIAGRVKEVKFFGSYYEIEVSLEGKVILVKSETGDFSVNSTVYVAILPDNRE